MSALFDPKFYRAAYQDLTDCYGKDELKGLARHFYNYGNQENRLCSIDMFKHVYTDINVSKLSTIIKHKYNLTFPNIEQTLGWVWTAKIPEQDLKTNDLTIDYNSLEINMFNIHLNNNILQEMYKNIDNFVRSIKNYKNILLLAGDFPGYGGAATNCDSIQKFLKSKKKNVYALYYNYSSETNKTVKVTKNYKIVYDEKHLLPAVKELPFHPDLVILKSPSPVDLKQIYGCPVYYMIGGIIQNGIDKPFWNMSKQDLLNNLHHPGITQIKNSDKSFCNSAHTRDIIFELTGLKTSILYTSLIPFYGKKIKPVEKESFNKRKYEYGILVSNVDRNVKNVEYSVNIVNGKISGTNKQAIIIGNNSQKYSNKQTVTSDIVGHDKINNDILPQIKYLRQDSHSESSSNVRIESMFTGCKISLDERIIVCSTQYPGWGGGATNAYAIIKYLRSIGKKTVGIFFDETITVPKADPDNIGDILVYSRISPRRQIFEETCKLLGGPPTLAMCKMSWTPAICKQIFGCFTVYLVAGNPLMSTPYIINNNISAQELLQDTQLLQHSLSNKTATRLLGDHKKCLEYSDAIVTNSLLSYNFVEKMYPKLKNKLLPVIDTSKYTTATNLQCNTSSSYKQYDIVICSSILTRGEKNNKLLVKVLANPVFDKYKKIIIGANNEMFRDIPNSTLTGVKTQKEAIELISKAKTYLCPSLFDASPNTVREAYAVQCIPIISNNVGFYECFPNDFVCHDLTVKTWTNKIINILNNYNKLSKIKVNYIDSNIEDLLSYVYEENE
jgi:glycosyltransferase involved in cell wall biosynthesis